MRILIVEDEPLVRERLQRLCRELLGPAAHVTAEGTLADADETLRARPLDVLLLDLNLDGEDGFSLLRTAVASAFHTIVVSAHAERAVQAFALGVLDFVPKPFTRERLAQALARAQGVAGDEGRAMRFLGVWRTRGVGLVPVDEVCWIRADGDYSQLRLASGRYELHDKSLDRLSALLPVAFVRCHRSYLVNLAHVDRLVRERGSRYALALKDGTQLPVGRSRVGALRERLG
ncbi:MAG: response regulator transcription factor [Gemmatimonadaceae bacterium]|nr:response regulator transcription factor [Gemmatimonadaceae bacterium]